MRKFLGKIFLLALPTFLASSAWGAKVYKLKKKSRRVYLQLDDVEFKTIEKAKYVLITKDDEAETEIKGKISKLFKGNKASIIVGRKIKLFKKGEEVFIDPFEKKSTTTAEKSTTPETAKKYVTAAIRGGYVSATIPGGGLDIGYRLSDSGWLVLQYLGGLSSTPVSTAADSTIETTSTSIQYSAISLSYRYLMASDYLTITFGLGQRLHDITYGQKLGNSESTGKIAVSATSLFTAVGSQLSFSRTYLFLDYIQAASPLSAQVTTSITAEGGFAESLAEQEADAAAQGASLGGAMTLAVGVFGFGFYF